MASDRALTGIISAARFPAPRPSSKGRRGPPLRRGEGPRTGPPLERSRGGSGARRIAPAAFGDFWPVKSRASVPARGRTPPRIRADLLAAKGRCPRLRRGKSGAAFRRDRIAASPHKKSALAGAFFSGLSPGRGDLAEKGAGMPTFPRLFRRSGVSAANPFHRVFRRDM